MPSTCSCVLSRVMQICGGTSSGISRRSCRYATRSTNGIDEVEARLEHRVEAAEPLDDPRVLLRHDANRLDDDDERDDEQREA